MNVCSITSFAQISDDIYYLDIWQCAKYFVATVFKALTLITIGEMSGLESRSRTCKSRSRLLWQSLGLVSQFELGLGGYGLDYITANYHKRMRFHHQETSNRHAKRRWSPWYISFKRMVNFWIKKCSEWFPELVEKWSYNYCRFARRIFLSKVSVKHRTCVTNIANVLTWTRARETPYDLNWPTCHLL